MKNSFAPGSNTVKSKLQVLDNEVLRIANEMNNHQQLLSEMVNATNPIDDLTQEKKTSSEELNKKFGKVEEEMQKHFAHQKAENARLQKQIDELKNQQTWSLNQVFASQRKIQDLAARIGIENLEI